MQLATGFVKDLPSPLLPDEITDRSKQLARTIEEIAEVELEAKKIASQFGTKLKGMRQRATDLAHMVSNGEERRPVLCSERADLRRFTVETYRHDNGTTVETRAMTQDEVEEARQTNLFGGVRVATEEKKPAGLDLEAPKDAAPPPATEVEPSDAATIEDPTGVLDGTAATPEKPKRARRRRAGQDVAEGAPPPEESGIDVSEVQGEGVPASPTAVDAALESIEKDATVANDRETSPGPVEPGNADSERT